MARILIFSDAQRVRDGVRSALNDGDNVFIDVDNGREVISTVHDQHPDLAILDMQVGSMGGIAVCMELRLEESGGRLPHIPVLLLLDRRPDVFLAERAGAEGWILKPLDAVRIRKAAKSLLAGQVFEDATYRPEQLEEIP